MFAIASLLDITSEPAARGLWERFELACALHGINSAPLPHFSWLAAENYQFEAVNVCLQELAAQGKPFQARASGLGIFSGPRPVFYIALVKSDMLLKLHSQLWQRTFPYSQGTSLYYAPDQWMPHITLAYNEVDAGRLGQLVSDMATQKIDFEFIVDHFAVLYQKEGDAGVQNRFPFQQVKAVGGTYELSGNSQGSAAR